MRIFLIGLLFLSCATQVAALQTPVATPLSAETKKQTAEGPFHPATPTLRLPQGIDPASYEISATVDPKAERMSSVTRIAIRLERSTDLIWLNQLGLEFSGATAIFEGRSVSVTVKPEAEHFVALSLASAIGPGEAVITINATAPLSKRENEGAFVGTEKEDNYVFTQFEAVGARRVFPVFDEPSFKVPWTLQLTVPKDMVALSNTNVVKEEIAGAMKTVFFGQTKPLPSYLLAFAVGPFEFVEGGKAGKNLVPVRIVVPKGQGARAQWAAEVTKEAVERLEAWFGIPYPFEKCDSIAVVNPSFSGAMENPGLITYAHTLIMAGPTGDTVSRRRNYLSTATHELAHQWFGNLVTNAWWDDIWLNESFADFVETRVLTKWKPEWDGEISRIGARERALGVDALGSVRRIREPIKSYDDIANVFDGITYAKGNSVLFMFEQWMGEEVFRKGVHAYLEKHAWKNATLEDFLKSMSEASGRDVKGPFSSFLDQPGFPMVSAELHCGSKVSLSLKQERFAAAGVKLEAQAWTFPICVKYEGGRQCTMMESATQEMLLETQTCPSWVLLNDNMAGYYRSKPTASSLISNKALSLAEKVGVARELSALVERGDISIEEPLRAVAPSVANGNRHLLSTAAGTLSSLREVLPEAQKPLLKAFVRSQFSKTAAKLGFLPQKGESEEAELMRPQFLGLMSDLGEDTGLRKQAMKLTRQWLKDHASIDAATARLALLLSTLNNDATLFDEKVKALQKETDKRQRRMILSSLGNYTDETLAKKALQLALSRELTPQEASILYFNLSEDPKTQKMSLEFVKSHYESLAKALPADRESSFVYIATASCQPEDRAGIVAFFEPRTTKALGGPREYANALEEFDQCVSWRANQRPAAIKFFESLRP
jgi:cytosol alanyl aminopeptidase